MPENAIYSGNCCATATSCLNYKSNLNMPENIILGRSRYKVSPQLKLKSMIGNGKIFILGRR